MGLRVLCIYTSDENDDVTKPLDGGSSIPFGLAMIATVLKNAGHDVHVLVLNFRHPFYQIVLDKIIQINPQLVCMTSVSSHFELIKKISLTVKSINPEIYTVLGGHHASLNPDDAISCGFFDAICLGEGEDGIVKVASILMTGDRPSDVLNFWFYQSDSNIIKNPLAPFNEHLDKLPFINRSLWESWIKEPDRRPSVLLGRGCPNSCSYCSNHTMRRLTLGRYVRQRSPSNVILELNKMCEENCNITSIYLDIETITARLEYLFEICKALTEFNSKRSNPIIFRTNLNLSLAVTKNYDIIDRILNAFALANIKSISLGLESGSERLRKDVLRRPNYSNEDFINFCQRAKVYGIKVFAFVIIGLPTETLKDWYQTLDVLRRSEVQNFYPYIFYPYPGTDIATMTTHNGVLTSQYSTARERYQVVFNQAEFPKTLVMKEFVMCRFRVFKGVWSLDRRISSVVKQFLTMCPKLEPKVLFLIRKFSLQKLFSGVFRTLGINQTCVNREDY